MTIQWSLVLFTALTGTAGCLYAALGIDEIRGKGQKGDFLISLIALIILAVGGLASVTHLSHPENIMGALSHPTSGIFVEAVLVGITGVLGIAHLVTVKRGSSVAKVFALLAGIVGLVLAYSAGSSYMMSAQIAWNTVLLPLTYLFTAIPSGVGLYAVLRCAKKEEIDATTPLILAAGAAVGLICAIAYGLASGAMDKGMTFMIVCFIGMAVAAVAGFMLKGKTEAGLTFAALGFACAFIGAVAFRCAMWVMGSSLVDCFGTVI